MMTTDFGKRLRRARKHAQLTQAELAARVAMSQSTLAAAEAAGAGSRKTPQLAAACSVNAHWLATGEGQMQDGIVPGVAVPNTVYRVLEIDTAAATVARLADLLRSHTHTRQRTLADMLHRFALDPADDELAAELSASLQPVLPEKKPRRLDRA